MKPQEIDSIYNELREDFAIIGLTGALGSGCTTSAKILSNALDNNFFKTFSDHYLSDISNKSSLEEYRLKKIETFINNKTWKSFYHLKVSNLLYCIFFNHTSKIYCDDFQTLDWFKNHNNIIETQKLCTKIVSLIMEPNGNKKRLFALHGWNYSSSKLSSPPYNSTKVGIYAPYSNLIFSCLVGNATKPS